MTGFDTTELAGTVAIVTGAGSGIGAASARALAAAGATVALLDVNADLGIAAAAAVVGRFIGTNIVDEGAVDPSLGEAIIA